MGKPAFIVAAVIVLAAVGAMALSGCGATGEQAATESAGVGPIGVASTAAVVAVNSPAADAVDSGAVDTVSSGAIESGAVSSGAVESGAVESGAAESGAVGAGSADSGATATANPGVTDGSISAQAIGTISGTPDVVTIVIGVQTQSASAQTALDDNNKKAADVIGVLKDSGVAPADLQTSQLSINPSYDEKGQQITGYQVTNMVTAKLRDISTAGSVIDAAAKTAGDAVRVQQLSFSIDDDSALRAQARADAVRRAQSQAKQMADAAGVQLGAIRSVTETPSATPTIYPAMAGADTAAASVPLEPGSQELSVIVQVIYAIGG